MLENLLNSMDIKVLDRNQQQTINGASARGCGHVAEACHDHE